LNSFGLAAGDAEQVADALFVTVKNGRTTIDELSRFLFQAAPVASQLGISYQELNAALVTLTKQGVPTRIAFTQIRSAVNGLVRDTPELTKAFEKFGGAQKVIKEQGLAAALQIVRDAAQGNIGTLNKLLGSIEGVGAVLGLTGPQLAEFAKQLREIEAASGDAAAAAQEVGKAFGVQVQEAVQAVSNLFEELGTVIVPVLEPAIVKTQEWADELRKLIRDNDIARFFASFVAGLGAGVTAIGLLLTALVSLAGGIIILRTAITILNLRLQQFALKTGAAAFAARSLGFAIRRAVPIIGTISIGMGLLTGAMSLFREETDAAADSTDKLKASFNNLNAVQQAAAIREQRQNVLNLEEQLRQQKAQLAAFEEVTGFAAPAQTFALELQLGTDEETVRAASKQTEESLEAAREFETEILNTFANVSDAEIDTTAIDDYAKNIQEFTNDLEKATAKQKELKAEAEKIFVPKLIEVDRGGLVDFLIPGGPAAIPPEASNAKEVAELSEKRRIADEAAAKAEADVNDIILGRAREIEKLRRATLQKSQLDAAAKAAEELKAANERQLAVAERELAVAKTANKTIQARVRQEAQLLRSRQALAQAQDEEALRTGEIDEATFAARQKQRIDEELEADLEGLNLRLEAVRREGAAKVADLRAKQAVDASKVSAEQIADAEVAAATAASAILVEIETVKNDAQTAALELGRDIAEGVVEGFSQEVSNIGVALQAELINLKSLLDAGLITAKEFADRVAAANQKAIESYKTLREALVEALAGADPATTADLVALIQQLDIAIAELTQTLSVFEQRLLTAAEGALADFFEETLNGVSSITDAFNQMFINIGNAAKRLIAEKLAQKVIESLFGKGSVLGGLFKQGGEVTPPPPTINRGFSGGGYLALAHGGSVSSPKKPSAGRMAYMAGVRAARRLKLARGGTVPHMRTGGRYEEEEEPRPSKRYKAARGGGILKLADGGGKVRGPGTKTSDSVPAMLSAGEYVIKASSVDRYGLQLMEALNRGLLKKRDLPSSRRRLSVTRPVIKAFAAGGSVGSASFSQAPILGGGSGGGSAPLAVGGTLRLEVGESAINLTMRDFLEREFSNAMASR
jgi:hypothetical protein